MKTYAEIEKEVRGKVAECYTVARNTWPNKTFPFPKIIINGIRGTTAGLAFYKENLIKFNYGLLIRNPDEFISRTCPHECGHIISFIIYGSRGIGHGNEWKSVCRILGMKDITRCHEYDVSQTRVGGSVSYSCNCHGRIFSIGMSIHHKICMGQKRSCKHCKAVIKRKMDN